MKKGIREYIKREINKIQELRGKGGKFGKYYGKERPNPNAEQPDYSPDVVNPYECDGNELDSPCNPVSFFLNCDLCAANCFPGALPLVCQE